MDTEKLIEQKTGENEHERRVRELSELLEELRVVLPGVQVLFAFLLVVPFSARFAEVTQLQQAVFFGTLMCTMFSAGLLIAPSAHHRLRWRQQVKEYRLRMANRLAIRGHGPARGGDDRRYVSHNRLPCRFDGRDRSDGSHHHPLLPLCVVRGAHTVPPERKVG